MRRERQMTVTYCELIAGQIVCYLQSISANVRDCKKLILYSSFQDKDESAAGSKPSTEDGLEKRGETSDEERRAENLADVAQFGDAHGRRDEHCYCDIRAQTRQTVLQIHTAARKKCGAVNFLQQLRLQILTDFDNFCTV